MAFNGFGNGGVRSNGNNFGGGGDDEGGMQGDGGNGDNEPLHTESTEENPFAALGELFGDDDQNQHGQQQQGQQQQQQQTQQQQQQEPDENTRLATEIQQMLQGMVVGEDAIPADFDVNDPKQLRELLSKTQQTAAMQTMQMAFKPMQAAIADLAKNMRTEIQSALSEFGGQNQARVALETLVPEINDSNLAGLVETLHKQALIKNPKNPKAAAQMVRKSLDALNIRGGNNNGGQRDSDPSQGGYRSGKSALDLFAPLPTPTQNNNNQRR